MSRIGKWARSHPDLILALRTRSQGKCELCGQTLDQDIECVDHDHTTGLIRGLLCFGCNIGLGHLESVARRQGRSLQEIVGLIVAYSELPKVDRRDYYKRRPFEPLGKRILAALSTEGPVRASYLAALLSAPIDQVSVRLSQLREKGLVVREDAHKWRAK